MRVKTAMISVLVLCAAPAGCQMADAPLQESLVVAPSFVAIRVQDIDAASTWYRNVFGLAEVNRIEAEDGRYAIRLLSGGGLSVELIQERGVDSAPARHLGHFKVGLYVSDIASFHGQLEARGVDVDADIFVDEALTARSFVFRDNEGNRLQAFQRCEEGC